MVRNYLFYIKDIFLIAFILLINLLIFNLDLNKHYKNLNYIL